MYSVLLVFQILNVLFYFPLCTAANNGDCVVSKWSRWGACSRKCVLGTRSRTRKITKHSSHIFAKPCPKLIESQECGKKNNGCEETCDKNTGKCFCLQGFMLKEDQKSCMDVNECTPNNGKGSCSYGCNNFIGGYKCLCPPNYFLDKDGHKCSKSVSPPTTCTADGIHTYDSQRNCICENKLSGLYCDRLVKDCHKLCPKEDVCLRLITASSRCVNKELQVPTILPIEKYKFNTTSTHYNIELYISRLIKGNSYGVTLKDLSRYSRRRRTTTKQMSGYYVEIVQSLAINKSITFVKFVVMDVKNKYTIVHPSIICAALENTDIRCLNNNECNKLQSYDINCPFVYQANAQTGMTINERKKIWVYIVISVCIAVFLVFILCFVYYRSRKRLKHKNTILRSVPLASEDTQENELYGMNDTTCGECDPLYESIENMHMENVTVTEASSNDINDKKLIVQLPEKSEPRYAAPPSIPNV